MTCERYWREGVMLVERGLPDPHRADCADCLQAHESRHELVRALPEIGAGYTGDPHWQANVWRRIEREKGSRPRWLWWLDGALAMACAILLLFGIGGGSAVVADNRPSLVFIKQAAATRSKSLTVVSGVRVAVEEGDEIRIYRDARLELQCPADPPKPGCTRDARGFVVEMIFKLPGLYQVIVAKAGIDALNGMFDHDLATLGSANSVRMRADRSVR